LRTGEKTGEDISDNVRFVRFDELFTAVTMKKAVFWDCGAV
jgi:hypothetical protein